MTTYTNFSKDMWAAFKADARPGPLHMLNLIRLREEANYPDGRAASGEEAYREYSRTSAPVFERLGGRIIWRGGFELTMIGPPNDVWDICFIAGYPSVAAFAEMLRDPVYQDAMAHRQAAVEDSRLIRLRARPAGTSFAGGDV